MIEELNLSEHDGFVHNLIRKWNTPEQDREDLYQDFYIHFSMYAQYDPSKGRPTTLIAHVFKNFMVSRKLRADKRKALNEATAIESRDRDYIDRECGGYSIAVEDEIYLNQLLSTASQSTIDLIVGDETCTSLAKKEGVTRQAISLRHIAALKKLTGE